LVYGFKQQSLRKEGNMILPAQQNAKPRLAVIKVVGIGSAGVNVVNTMIERGLDGVQFIAINTDIQHLDTSLAEIKIELTAVTQGRGVGGDPSKGRDCALAARSQIEEALAGADLVIIVTGLGGGTGSGVTPVVGEIAQTLGILSVAFATMPFKWEGVVRAKKAFEALELVKSCVDSYIVLPNDKLMKVVPPQTRSEDFWKVMDSYLCDVTTGLVELISRPGHINRDLEDLRAALEKQGPAVIGVGEAEGENRASLALEKALMNPLLEDTPVVNAGHLLVNVMQGPDGLWDEMSMIFAKMSECMAPAGELVPGYGKDDSLEGKIRVTIIASGLQEVHDAGACVVEIEESMSKSLPKDARGLPNYAIRPSVTSQGGLDRLKAPVTPRQHTLNKAGETQAEEGVSELDPYPAYLRLSPERSSGTLR
jgi:cell division protein FtsZ